MSHKRDSNSVVYQKCRFVNVYRLGDDEMIVEIFSFFALVCTPASGQPNVECVDWLYGCWVEQLEAGKEPWHGAEVCSELLDPEKIK